LHLPHLLFLLVVVLLVIVLLVAVVLAVGRFVVLVVRRVIGLVFETEDARGPRACPGTEQGRSRDGAGTERRFDHDAGSAAGFAFSRFGGGYVVQKWRPHLGHTQN
jgi:hypothetical protein